MKKNVISIIVILLIVIGVVVFYGVRYMKTPVDTQIVKLSNHENKIETNAYIVRHENVYTAGTNGTFYSREIEGSRVGKLRSIASIYRGTVDTAKLMELNNIDKKIAQAQAQKRQSSWFSSDAGGRDNQIESKKDDIVKAVKENDIAKISTYKAELSAMMTGETTTSDSDLESLISQKNKIESSIGTTSVDIKSDISGVYNTNVDGLESVLTPEKVMNFTVGDYDELQVPAKREAKITVNSDDEVCKISDNHEWFAMSKVPVDKLSDVKIGTSARLRFAIAPSIEAQAKVVYKSEEKDGFVVLVFKSEQYVDGIFTIRNSDVDIILNSYSGYYVPISAVRVINSQNGVMIKNRRTEVFGACDVLYTNKEEGYAIVYPLADAKQKLKNGDNVLLGEKVAGGGN